MTFCICPNVSAVDISSELEEETIVKVGYLENYGIVNVPSIRGAEGFGYEYLEEIEKNTHYKFTYISTTWAEGFEMLERGEIDLFGTASMNEERKKRVEFVETPICHESACIFAPIDSKLYYNDPSGLDGLTIGLTQGSVYREWVEKYTTENNIELNIKFSQDTDFMSQIKAGEIDVFLAGSLLQLEGSKIIDELYSEPLYFISTKGNESLCNDLEQAIVDIEESNPYFNELLWYKYYGDNQKANKYITQDERLALAQKDIYTVGYHADLHPISYIDKDSKPKGYAIDVMNVLAEKLDMAIIYVPLHGEKDTHPKDLDFNLCPLADNCMNHGHFSEPYDLQNLLVVRDFGVSKSEVQDIVVPNFATVNIEDFLFLYPSATVHKSISSTDSSKINEELKPDCRIIPEGSEMLIVDKKDKNISVLDVSLPIGVMVSEQLPIEVLTAMNKAIKSLSKGVVDELVLENVMLMQSDVTLLDLLSDYKDTIFIVFILIMSAFVYIVLEARKHTKELLEIDTLTGLPTKYKFVKDVMRVLSKAKPNEYMLVLLDVDNFKLVNKTMGVACGDKLLCSIAMSLTRYVDEDAIISRIQNDVFAVFMKNIEMLSLPTDEVLEQDIRDLDLSFQVYFSVGVYPIENPKRSIAEMLDDTKAVKNIGKTTFGSTFYTYTNELKDKFEKEYIVLSSMEKALEDEEFFILIQPKVELQTLNLIGGEVLVRWKKADGTFIYPDEFIPIFEKNQFIEQLDAYVFEQSCIFIKNSDLQLPLIAVNISAVSLLIENCVERYLSIAQKHGINPNQLELELTESAIEADFEKVKKIIRRFKDCGFHIAIDDFGKGESSLTRVKELSIDTIKLDKGFIDKKIETEKDRVVLENLIKMINDLGYSTITEGIETENHRKLILNMGCEYGQGYLFDRPLPLTEFLLRVKSNTKEERPKVTHPLERIKKAFRDIELLPYSVVMTMNDSLLTVIESNENFYKLIGYSKLDFLMMCCNSLNDIVVENLTEVFSANNTSPFSADIHIKNDALEETLVHAYVSYNQEQNVYIITLMV